MIAVHMVRHGPRNLKRPQSLGQEMFKDPRGLGQRHLRGSNKLRTEKFERTKELGQRNLRRPRRLEQKHLNIDKEPSALVAV